MRIRVDLSSCCSLIVFCLLVVPLLLPVTAGSLSAGDDKSSLTSDDSRNKVIMYRGRIPIEVDYEKGVLIVKGKEIPIIVDGDFEIIAPRAKDSWVHLSYERFEVYIDSAFYANNAPELDLYFDRFEPRYQLMEDITGWSSERFYGEKLEIYVEQYTNCIGGHAIPTEAHIKLYSDLSNPNLCRRPYYVDGIEYYNNPGELGDHWYYMTIALHEALHAINPLPVFSRTWLTEGWAMYHQYNILSSYYGNQYPDINQETADYYNYHGTPWFNWECYVANDYRDCSLVWNGTDWVPRNAPIQESAGYNITAWMLSMLRDDHSLPWDTFYSILNNNLETLDGSMELGDYFTDTHVIDLFERAIGTPMYPVFRYDGPEGPGWGVRQWESLDWYADLAPVLEVSDTTSSVGDTISLNATVYNNGDVTLNDVVVRFYSNDSLIDEQTTSVDSNGFTEMSAQYTAAEGDYVIRVVVDEDDLKIETDDSNNEDSVLVSFEIRYGDANADGVVNVADVVYLVNFLYRGGDPPLPMEAGDANCDQIVNVADVVYLVNYLYRGGDPPGCP